MKLFYPVIIAVSFFVSGCVTAPPKAKIVEVKARPVIKESVVPDVVKSNELTRSVSESLNVQIKTTLALNSSSIDDAIKLNDDEIKNAQLTSILQDVKTRNLFLENEVNIVSEKVQQTEKLLNSATDKATAKDAESAEWKAVVDSRDETISNLKNNITFMENQMAELSKSNTIGMVYKKIVLWTAGALLAGFILKILLKSLKPL